MEILVNIDEIKEHGLELDRELPAAELDDVLQAEPPTGFSTAEAARLLGRLDRVNEVDIVFRGRFQVNAQAECRRCLDPVRVPLAVDFTLDLVRKDELLSLARQAEEDDGEGAVAASFDPSQLDELAFSGKRVDLWPAVREQLLLAVPMHALCRDDCKGLCQICGGNLNERTCTCERSVPDPRWAALRNVKLQG